MGEFEVTRSTTVAAPPARVRALVEDFRAWRRWSPWEGIDPALRRDYAGPARGPGATYRWEGNRRAGAGRMEVTASTAERVEVDLTFLKPFRASSVLTFDLVPAGAPEAGTDAGAGEDGGAGTRVTWTMRGRRTGLLEVLGPLLPMDRLVGKDFERGLAQLRREAEAG